MPKLDIREGQYWRSRNGACLKIHHKVEGGWRVYYAQHITETVDDYGRMLGPNLESGFDLIEEIK